MLYETVREYIGDIDNQVVFDLFSGTGTIGQVLAPVAKKVIGVEIIEEAVEAAKKMLSETDFPTVDLLPEMCLRYLMRLKKPDVRRGGGGVG